MNHPLIIGTNGTVAAIDPSTGKMLWETKLETGGIVRVTKGMNVNVMIRDEVVYAGSSGHLFCLDIRNGNTLWHNDLEGYGYGEISLAMTGVSVQQLTRVVHRS